MPLDLSRPSSEALDRLSDEDLIARARKGDSVAFGLFVRRHATAVHRWMARSVGAQDADDLTQEVFLKAYRALGQFRGDAPARAWLASVADNTVKNRYRSLSRFRRIFSGADPDRTDASSGAADPEESARAGASRRFVAEALKRIPSSSECPSSSGTWKSGATRRSPSRSRSRSGP